VTSPPAPHELLFAALLTAGLAAGVLPPVAPRLATAPAVAAGLAVGLLLHRALAGQWVALPRPRLAGSGRLGPLVLVGRAAVEELAWRGFLLGALIPPLGAPGALAASSLLFACAHHVRRPADRLVHTLTGGVFGLVYLVTGRLAAAMAAHIAYNALVAATDGVRSGA